MLGLRRNKDSWTGQASLAVAGVLILSGIVCMPLFAQSKANDEAPAPPEINNVPFPPPLLADDCIVSVLNRELQVNPDGTFAIPNVPADLGFLRVRATCLRDGQTLSGQSGFLDPLPNGVTRVGPIDLESFEPIPIALRVTPRFIELGPDPTPFEVQLTVTGVFADGPDIDLTAGSTGTFYTTSNSETAFVSGDGLVTGIASGVVIISAMHEGLVGSGAILVTFEGDSDRDGLPDDYEFVRRCLDENLPDAIQDPDGDGLSSFEEFQRGTEPCDDDTDGDACLDGEEIREIPITDPLNPDSDFDLLVDCAEIDREPPTDPNDPDTDNGCLIDGVEIQLGLDPLAGFDDNVDSDDDGLRNCDETFHDPPIDPRNPDTDGDSCFDGEELFFATDPLVPSPGLQVTPEVLLISVVAGGPSPQAGELQISNRCGGDLNWSAEVGGQAWLTLVPAEGVLAAGETVTVTAIVDTATLPIPTSGCSEFNFIRVEAPGAVDSEHFIDVTVSSLETTGDACQDLFFTRRILKADDCFEARIQANPNDQLAHLFRSVTRIMRIFEEQVDGPDPARFTDSVKELLDQFGVMPEGEARGGLLAGFDILLPDPLLDDSPTAGDLQEFLETVLVDAFIASIDENLSQITPDISYTVDGNMRCAFIGELDPDEIDRIVEIDFGDVKLYEATLSAAAGLFQVFPFAYDIDIDIDALSAIDDPRLQEDILDMYPNLLRLRPDGAATLLASRESLQRAIEAYYTASDLIRNIETDDQSDDFVTIDPVDLPEEELFRVDLGTVYCGLDGGTLVSLDETVITCDPDTLPVPGRLPIDATNYIDVPFDLRDKLPPFSFDGVCEQDFIDVSTNPPTATSPFPDPTFCGVLPALDQIALVDRLKLFPRLEVDFFSPSMNFGFVGTDSGEFAVPLEIFDIRFEDGTFFELLFFFGEVPTVLCGSGSSLFFSIGFSGPPTECIRDTLIIESSDTFEPIRRIDYERGPCAPLTNRHLRGE